MQLWNRTLLENVRYGADGSGELSISAMLEQADFQVDVRTGLFPAPFEQMRLVVATRR